MFFWNQCEVFTKSASEKQQPSPAGLGQAWPGRVGLGLLNVLSQINYTTGNKSGGFLSQEIWCYGSDIDAGVERQH